MRFLSNFRIYGSPPSPGVYNDTKERTSKFGSILGRDWGLVNNCSPVAGRAPNWTGRAFKQFLPEGPGDSCKGQMGSQGWGLELLGFGVFTKTI